MTISKLRMIAKFFLCVYLHAPLCLQVLNFPHAEIKEEIQYIDKMLTHNDMGLPTLQWLMLNLEQAQLEVGIGIPLLESLYEQYGFLCTDSWIKVLWCFVLTYNILLMDRNFFQWEGDEFIMKCLVMSDRFDEAAQ